MSRLDKLFGPKGDGSSGIGSDAELVSLLNRIVADIDRIKRGAYQGPGASFSSPFIIDNYQLEFINGSLIATSTVDGSRATFGSVAEYQKAIFIGDEFIGFPPNSSTWGTSPYGAAGNRWQDLIVQTYQIPVQVDGTVLGATTTSLLTNPRAVFGQSCNLLVICVGSHDMLSDPAASGSGGITNLQKYKNELRTLITSYTADTKLVVFPWHWFSSVTNYPVQYSVAAQDVALSNGCKFINLNALSPLSSSYVVSSSSTTNSTPSFDGAQVIFAAVQKVLNA